jgi:hypothetical protein
MTADHMVAVSERWFKLLLRFYPLHYVAARRVLAIEPARLLRGE